MAIHSVLGLVAGVVVIVVSVLSFWFYHIIATFMRNVPIVGETVLDWAGRFRFPGGQVAFPAFGALLIVWAIALSTHKSWARIVGIALHLLVAFHLVALAVLVTPFWNAPVIKDHPVLAEYRWWVLPIWIFFLGLAIYLAFDLAARRSTEQRFAAQYIGRPVIQTCDRCGTNLNSLGQCPRCEGTTTLSSRSRPSRLQPPAAESSRSQGTSSPDVRIDGRPAAPTEQRVLGRLRGADGAAHELRKQETTVGRDPSNDIALEDSAVSALHAKIIFQKGQFAVEDLGSTNGTYVNGIKVDRSRLEDQCTLELGRVAFTFEIVADS